MIKTALIVVTLAALLCSLWIRRYTWRSRWEAGATRNIALHGCAVLLMSHWAAAALDPRYTASSGCGTCNTCSDTSAGSSR